MTGSAKPGSATSRPGKAGQPQALLLLLVIASVAKQSISFFMPRDGLLRFARNDGRIRLRVLAAHCARGLRLKPCPLKLRAQGRPGGRCTRGLACNCANKNAHEHTGSAETLRPSLRSGFTAYFVLSPVNGSFATVAGGTLPANLTPAPRRQDHTTSPYASCALVCCALRVHRIPPHVRDDHDPPLDWVRRAELCR